MDIYVRAERRRRRRRGLLATPPITFPRLSRERRAHVYVLYYGKPRNVLYLGETLLRRELPLPSVT